MPTDIRPDRTLVRVIAHVTMTLGGRQYDADVLAIQRGSLQQGRAVYESLLIRSGDDRPTRCGHEHGVPGWAFECVMRRVAGMPEPTTQQRRALTGGDERDI